MNRDEIKIYAKENGLRVKDLLALTPGYDPFYVGSDSDHVQAKWAKELLDWVLERWEERRTQLEQLGIEVGAMPHIRAIHYLLFTGHPNPIKWDGKRYKGSHGEWKLLQEAFKKAKLLGYIDFGIIEDHKHPDVTQNLIRWQDRTFTPPEETESSQEFSEDDMEITFDTETIKDALTASYESTFIEEIRVSVEKRIPVHIELWTEKEREVVSAVAGEFWVNVQDAVGQQTYENVYLMLKRAQEVSRNRPLRILYLSDFDPRGEMTMPIGVARIIEWMLANLDEFTGMDIKLRKLILTNDQIQELNLPPAPVKSTESMKERWEAIVGDYICEIDSIDTLFAPDMVRIMRTELSRYIPSETVKKITDYQTKLIEAFETYNDALDDKVQAALEAIHEEFAPKMAPIIEELQPSIDIDMAEELQTLIDAKEDFEEPDWEVDDGDEEWLFDSERDYGEQLQKYKKVRGN